MTIQEQLKIDLTQAIKDRQESRKDALRVIMGELSRGGKKQFEDAEIVPILKKLIKSEREVLEKRGADTSDFIQVVESYLPNMATANEIQVWIEANIDWTRFKNKMQAMGPVMKHFGARADGNLVKRVLSEMA